MLSRISTIVLIIFVNNLLGYGSSYFLQLRPRVMNRNSNLHVSLGQILNIPTTKERSFDSFKLRGEFLNKAESYTGNRKPYTYKVYKPYQHIGRRRINDKDYVNRILDSIKWFKNNNFTQRVNGSIEKQPFTTEKPAEHTSGVDGFDYAYKVSLTTIMLPLEVDKTTVVPSTFVISPTESISRPTTEKPAEETNEIDGFDDAYKVSLTTIELPLKTDETTVVPSTFLISSTTSRRSPTSERYADDLSMRTTTTAHFVETTVSELFQTYPQIGDLSTHSLSETLSSTTESFVDLTSGDVDGMEESSTVNFYTESSTILVSDPFVTSNYPSSKDFPPTASNTNRSSNPTIPFLTLEEAEAELVSSEISNFNGTNLEVSYSTLVPEITTDSSTEPSTIPTSERFEPLPTTTDDGISKPIHYSEENINIAVAEKILKNSFGGIEPSEISTSALGSTIQLPFGNESIEYTSPLPGVTIESEDFSSNNLTVVMPTVTEFGDLISIPIPDASSVADIFVDTEDSSTTQSNTEISTTFSAETAPSTTNEESLSAYPIEITTEVLPYIETSDDITDSIPTVLKAGSRGINFRHQIQQNSPPGFLNYSTTPKIFIVMEENSSIESSTISTYTQTSTKTEVDVSTTTETPEIPTNSEIFEGISENTRLEENTETSTSETIYVNVSNINFVGEVSTAADIFEVIDDTFTMSSHFSHLLSPSEAEAINLTPFQETTTASEFSESYPQTTFMETSTEASKSMTFTSTEFFLVSTDNEVLSSSRIPEETTMAELLENSKNHSPESTSISASKSIEMDVERTTVSAEDTSFSESIENVGNYFKTETPIQSSTIFELPETTEDALNHSDQEKTTAKVNYVHEISYTTLSQVSSDQDALDSKNNASSRKPETTSSIPTEKKEITYSDHKLITTSIENSYLETATDFRNNTKVSTIDGFTDNPTSIFPLALTTTSSERPWQSEDLSYSTTEFQTSTEFVRETSTSVSFDEESTSKEEVQESRKDVESLETTQMPEMEVYTTSFELDTGKTTTKVSNEIITELYAELSTESWMPTLTTEDSLKQQTTTSINDIRSDSFDFYGLATEKLTEYQNDEVYSPKSIIKKIEKSAANHNSQNQSLNHVASKDLSTQLLNTSRDSSRAQVNQHESALKLIDSINQNSIYIGNSLKNSSSVGKKSSKSLLKIVSTPQLSKPRNLHTYQKPNQIKYSTDVMPSLDDLF